MKNVYMVQARIFRNYKHDVTINDDCYTSMKKAKARLTHLVDIYGDDASVLSDTEIHLNRDSHGTFTTYTITALEVK
jgi:hypothetical protein